MCYLVLMSLHAIAHKMIKVMLYILINPTNLRIYWYLLLEDFMIYFVSFIPLSFAR